ncbi:RimJ/RimL family protein N-acetyltransferase [Microbacterium endophyticum]|uniref:RimJ/RimL family protein N-acetyltransferase n=1 Tax=Microbacterium endophyticum TaxID=1526412 RepID=A0A7W4V4A5_9MICO|nr:GNAT family N-acetyltransferase [Microbacterium endophyticum]MBB2976587.1 RimJ/RimL family protein N-acetyltransferase [Microbacterium endophyticum]NIK37530.1 RimJ/RimL family protein N-acetyltransferase [Microbacterium endophyticum]
MTWPTATALETSRFSLEPLSQDHADEMTAVLADASLYTFTGDEPPTRDELRARYARQSVGHSPSGDAGWLNWIIREKTSQDAIGYIQATVTVDDNARAASMAWLISPAKQGLGAATEAGITTVTWLAAQGIQIVRAEIHPDHRASEAVASRLGLAPTLACIDGERVWQRDLRSDG